MRGCTALDRAPMAGVGLNWRGCQGSNVNFPAPPGKPLALALHPLPAGNLTLAGGTERSVVNLDPTLSLVVADHQASWSHARPGQLERMRRRAVGEEFLAAAQHDRHRENADRVDEII